MKLTVMLSSGGESDLEAKIFGLGLGLGLGLEVLASAWPRSHSRCLIMTDDVRWRCYLTTIAYLVCCEAVRSAILETAWLVVLLCIAMLVVIALF